MLIRSVSRTHRLLLLDGKALYCCPAFQRYFDMRLPDFVLILAILF